MHRTESWRWQELRSEAVLLTHVVHEENHSSTNLATPFACGLMLASQGDSPIFIERKSGQSPSFAGP
jgi:hypothetical protein